MLHCNLGAVSARYVRPGETPPRVEPQPVSREVFIPAVKQRAGCVVLSASLCLMPRLHLAGHIPQRWSFYFSPLGDFVLS